jgi:hypothetical protein
MLRVLICDHTNTILVDEKYYNLRECVDLAYQKVRANNSYGMSPFFYSGSPYGQSIVDLGALEITRPIGFRPSFLPHDGKRPAMAQMKWATIFNVDPDLHDK